MSLTTRSFAFASAVAVAVAFAFGCGGASSSSDGGGGALDAGSMDAASNTDAATGGSDGGGQMVLCDDGMMAPVGPPVTKLLSIFGGWHFWKKRVGNQTQDLPSDCDQNTAYHIGMAGSPPADLEKAVACHLAAPNVHRLPFFGGTVDVITNQNCTELFCAGNDQFVFLWNPDSDSAQIFIESAPGSRTLWGTLSIFDMDHLFLSSPFSVLLERSAIPHCMP